ncbi:MAG: hypothetical protein ACRD4F_16870, partial [Candidatus Angelobacter sp.]
MAIFIFGYMRFSFAERRSKAKPVELESQAPPVAVGRPVPVAQIQSGSWAKLAQSLKIHLRGTVLSVPFIVVMLAGGLNCLLALMFNATEGYGNQTLPVTYWVLDLIRGTLYLFIVIVITFYAGVLVWKDRDERMDEIVDAAPTPEWVSYSSRLITLVFLVLLIQLGALFSGLAVQAWHGYHRFQLGLYAHELLVRDGSLFIFLAVLAFFIQALSPNKYVGYFGYIAVVTLNFFIWRPLNISTLLIQFGNRPTVTYSDFYGEAPFTKSWDWFTLYWLVFCSLLAILTVMFWPRGKQDRWAGRANNAAGRFSPGWRFAAALGLVALVATGGWIFYNTKVVNPLLGPKDRERRQADYEKDYKQFEKMRQPR